MSYGLIKTLQMCRVKIESGLGYKSSQVRVPVQVQQNGLNSGLEYYKSVPGYVTSEGANFRRGESPGANSGARERKISWGQTNRRRGRDAEGVEGRVCGGVSPLHPTSGSGRASWAPPAVSGAEQRIWCILMPSGGRCMVCKDSQSFVAY